MIYIIILLCSFLCTLCIKKYALKNNVIDIPNERSSHSTPTPRGGGLSVVITFLVSLAVCIYIQGFDLFVGISLFVGGALVAFIGFIDDHGHVDAKWRLLIHSIASFCVVYSVNGLPVLDIFGVEFDFGVFGYFLSVVAIIWILNLFNFMDGIDGIAGVEAITCTFFAGLFLSFISPESSLVTMLWLLTASVSGFLLLNFPPAKIFMGDAGSGFLGFMLAVFALVSSTIDQSMLWVWLILLGVFIVDATFTMVRRFARGEKIYEAHCSHAYQFASRKYSSHLKVTLSVLIINVFWLAPMAYLVINETLNGASALCISYIPLIGLAIKYSAGAEQVE
ncbi:glycosyltransferase family 4 protein [Colwelliaceae bacterium BS250]